MNVDIHKANTEMLQRWLAKNEWLLGRYNSTTEAAEIELCKTFLRDIRRELLARAE